MNKILLPVVVMVITYVHMSYGGHNALSTDEINCIRSVFDRSSPSAACTEVERSIEALYSVDDGDDFLVALATNLNLFDTFCQQSCGQVIIDALGACGVYTPVINQAQLLINLCSTNNGRACYRDFVSVADLFSSASICAQETQSTGSCSLSCRNTLETGVQNYGCCVNIPITFTQAESPADGINAGANQLFTACGVSRPATCPASQVGPPRSSPGGAGHTVAAGTILLTTSIISMLMTL